MHAANARAGDRLIMEFVLSPTPGDEVAEAGTVLRSILATAPNAMVVSDEQGRILSFSRNAERMFGFMENEIVGKNVSTLMTRPDSERHDTHLEWHRTTGEHRILGLTRVTTARRRDGSDFPIELTVGEAQTAEGRVFTGFIRDLTETRRAERRLNDLRSELAQVSRVSMVGTFATALAHELNQPLTAIANYVETARDLLDANDPAEQMLREALDEAAKQSLRAGLIVRRLREFVARGDARKSAHSLDKLVAEATALLMAGTPPVEFDIRIELDPAGDLVVIDRAQILQALLNLLRNALEAMEQAAVKRLEIRSKLRADDFVEVIVSDSGKGIEPEIAATLFEPFQSTKDAGIGLGLSICRTVVESQGGRIWTERSALGGAAFHFILPLARRADDTDAESGRRDHAALG